MKKAKQEKQYEPVVTRRLFGIKTKPVGLTGRLRKYLADNPMEAEAIVLALIRQGKLGNIQAVKELLDRIDGKVVETHRIEGELPIKLVFGPAEGVLGQDKPSIVESEVLKQLS